MTHDGYFYAKNQGFSVCTITQLNINMPAFGITQTQNFISGIKKSSSRGFPKLIIGIYLRFGPKVLAFVGRIIATSYVIVFVIVARQNRFPAQTMHFTLCVEKRAFKRMH